MLLKTRIKKKATTGRSMVEMIAVLAIMGILSLGALSGINYVKDKNLANQILKEALTQASELQTTRRIKTKPNTSLEIIYPYEKTSEYIKSWAFVDDNKETIVLRAFNVSGGVCRKIVSAEPVEIFNCITVGENTTTCENISPQNCDAISNAIAFIADAKVTVPTTGGPIDPCANVDCKTAQTGKVCSGGVCICPVGTAENEDGVCVDCAPPKRSCNANDSWDTKGCQIWEHLDCSPDDCNLKTGSCCPNEEKYFSEIENCCPPERFAKKTGSKGKCCPPNNIGMTDGTCCIKTQFASKENDGSGKCCPAGTIVSAAGKCVCPNGLQQWDENKKACVCIQLAEGADPTTCECPEGYDIVDGKCVVECPSVVGMTGMRNQEGKCLCDTTAGYEEVSVDNSWCNCDNSRYYWNKPDGSCLTCVQTTKEWARTVYGDGSQPGKRGFYPYDSESVNEDVWYCNMYRLSPTFQIWNPSTRSYCPNQQVLIKNGNNFVCSRACGNAWSSGTGRWIGSSLCICPYHTIWNGTSCVNPCPANYTAINGKDCIPCSSQYYLYTGGTKTYDTTRNMYIWSGGTCQDPCTVCNSNPNIECMKDGSIAFGYSNWKNAVKDNGCFDENSGYVEPSLISTSPCYYKKGCVLKKASLPACATNSKITNNCSCPTGGNIGEYCCSSAQIKTSSGCQNCSGNTVPNALKTECEQCAENQIPNSTHTACIYCPAGQIPNATKTKCYPCPEGTRPDETGTVCI